MYAIIKDGGNQIKVEEGQTLDVDYRDLAKGDELKFASILAVSGGDGLKVGSPTVEGASVTAEVLGAAQGDKMTVVKFRRRKNSRRRNGHRQLYTSIQIKKIEIA
jgi:large subunit ribosomal protein L21